MRPSDGAELGPKPAMAEDEAKTTFNLKPGSLVKEIVEQKLRLFLAVYSEITFLLVRLNDQSGELLAGLSAASAAGKPGAGGARSDGIGFYTVQQSQMDSSRSRRSISIRPMPDMKLIKRRISIAPHFVVELRKREKDASYMNRVSVGRARNQDVVLRHASVSKSHAWFETSETGGLYVADAGSKNGTWVNGARCEAPTTLKDGDEVVFGTVRTVFRSSVASGTTRTGAPPRVADAVTRRPPDR